MSMVVVYDSLTGQSARFANRLGLEAIDIIDYEPQEDAILLVTRSWDFGKVSEEATEFLDQYAAQVVGVCVSGNRNWGTNYGAAGVKISEKYDIDLVLKFEGSGFSKDIEFAQAWIATYKERTEL